MNTARYANPFDSFGDADHSRLICKDCSTRSTAVVIPADEREAHDTWHNHLNTERTPA